jgi:hypothetical protein
VNRNHSDYRRFKQLRRELRNDKWKIYIDVLLLVALILVTILLIHKHFNENKDPTQHHNFQRPDSSYGDR